MLAVALTITGVLVGIQWRMLRHAQSLPVGVGRRQAFHRTLGVQALAGGGLIISIWELFVWAAS